MHPVGVEGHANLVSAPGGGPGVSQREIMAAINDFLRRKAKPAERQLFLRRYFWGDSIGELTVTFRSSESKIKSQLFRTRQRLRRYLEERGLV